MIHQTFEKSRILEYFSKKELSMQMGASPDEWPLMLLKELIDNAIDACESAGVPPVVTIEVGDDYFAVLDNGLGLPFQTVARSLDYSVRVSSNDAYIRPTRGQLGNALKLVWAAPYVATGQGKVTVIGDGYQHQITVSADPLTGEPTLAHDYEEIETDGTSVKIDWPGVATPTNPETGPDLSEFALRELCRKYTILNPHLTIAVTGLWQFRIAARERDWKAWRASQPGSIHWYSFSQFCELIKRYLVSDRQNGRDTTLREFLSVFDGFKSTAKQAEITDYCNLKGALLKDLLEGEELSEWLTYRIYLEMRGNAKPVTAARFGKIGDVWGQDYAIQKTEIIDGDKRMPCVVESAFRVVDGYQNFFCFGLNNAVVFYPPASEIDEILADNFLLNTVADGVAFEFLLHIRCPEFSFLDRGKQRMDLSSEMLEAIAKTVGKSCRKWRKAVERLRRNETISRREMERYEKTNRPKRATIKRVAYELMEEAYLRASDGGRLPANARQIMYAARPYILERITEDEFSDSYFTQTLIPDFMRKYPELTASWKVAYDARGNLIEPRGRTIPLGTLAVERYLSQWRSPTYRLPSEVGVETDGAGPIGNYHAVLFLEKEGFHELLEESQIAEKYDIAIMSTKGMSSTASRQLLEELSRRQIPVFVLHDFDKSGLSILHTFRTDTRRYQFDVKPIVHDLGVRLDDVERLGLQSEPVLYKSQQKDPRIGILKTGASQAEANFLVEGKRVYRGKEGETKSEWYGRRVELNALTSRQLLDIIEPGLQSHGIGKLVPDEDLLIEYYRQNVKIQKINAVLQHTLKNLEFDDFYIPSPEELRGQIEKHFSEDPTLSWSDALRLVSSGDRL